jgi:hypothetical protein
VGVKNEKGEKREEEITCDEEKREEDNQLGGTMSNIILQRKRPV